MRPWKWSLTSFSMSSCSSPLALAEARDGALGTRPRRRFGPCDLDLRVFRRNIRVDRRGGAGRRVMGTSDGGTPLRSATCFFRPRPTSPGWGDGRRAGWSRWPVDRSRCGTARPAHARARRPQGWCRAVRPRRVPGRASAVPRRWRVGRRATSSGSDMTGPPSPRPSEGSSPPTRCSSRACRLRRDRAPHGGCPVRISRRGRGGAGSGRIRPRAGPRG